jgi:protein-S-isoprenylcysteine O-methyltransferase Ste14
MIALYDQWNNQTAWLYLALHGSYGFLWLFKSRIFPDQAWEERTNLAFGLVIWGSLSLYWVAPWLLVSRGVEAPGWYLAICVSLYSFGLFAHFASDMQKHVALQLRPNQLITDRLFAYTRNMNYFGELLIYAGFGLLAMHWLPVLILLLWVTAYWLPRMRKKDQLLSQYQGFEAYKKRTKLFIPFLF